MRNFVRNIGKFTMNTYSKIDCKVWQFFGFLHSVTALSENIVIFPKVFFTVDIYLWVPGKTF